MRNIDQTEAAKIARFMHDVMDTELLIDESPYMGGFYYTMLHGYAAGWTPIQTAKAIIEAARD